ncbi:hypothetical protein OAQ62_00300 [bacterium]|jgi:hypothetical protein|nr:hypothetical protein [bacterium]
MYKDIFTNLLETKGFGRWEFEYNNVIQCVFPIERIKTTKWFPAEFIEQFNLLDEHLIGAETIPANQILDGHIDHIRKSNLLINVGNTASIFHHNNDIKETVILKHGDMFLLNTRKEHGSENTHPYNYKFLTINTRQDFWKAKEQLGV